MRKFRLIFVMALLFQLVLLPIQSLVAEAENTPPTWFEPIQYLALGDSSAFGINSNNEPDAGYADYLAQTLFEKKLLQRQNKGFAVSGYTTVDVLKDLQENVTKPSIGIGHTGEELVLHQSIKDADLITISAGANDILKHVKQDPETGEPKINALAVMAETKKVGANYQEILASIKKINPHAQIFVMGYYNPFPHLRADLQPSLNQMLAGLNKAIQTGMTGTNAVFVPTSEVIAENYVEFLPNPQNIHLSESGYRAVANQFNLSLEDNFNWLAGDLLTAEIKNETTVTLSWKPTINRTETRYLVYKDGEKVGEVDGTRHSFEVTELSAEETYLFKVVAVDEKGNESSISPEVSITLGPIAPLFSDIDEHWAKGDIEKAAKANIIRGYSDGTFKPNNHLSRAQAASILVRALDLKATKPSPFTDIQGYHEETQAEIAAAYQFGLVKKNDGKFNPGEKITRAQLALMVKRAHELLTGQPYFVDEFAPFPDITNYDDEAKTAITMLYNFEVIEGSKGKFLPRDATTRAHAAKIFVNYMAYMGK